MAGSAALVADAVHSVTDLISDVVTLWAVQNSRQPADDLHPFGHGKVLRFVVSALLSDLCSSRVWLRYLCQVDCWRLVQEYYGKYMILYC